MLRADVKLQRLNVNVTKLISAYWVACVDELSQHDLCFFIIVNGPNGGALVSSHGPGVVRGACLGEAIVLGVLPKTYAIGVVDNCQWRTF